MRTSIVPDPRVTLRGRAVPDLGAAVHVSLLVAGDVVGDLGFESLREHPPCPLASDLIEVRRELLALDTGHVGHSLESSFREILRTEVHCYPVASGRRPLNPRLSVIPLHTLNLL